MERRKLFSTTRGTRRRLFSSVRRRLFSDRILVCQDCGHELHTSATSTDQVCPNCGSANRFYVREDGGLLYPRTSGGSSVVQLEDVTADDATGEIMKKYSAQPISRSALQKLFTERGVTETIDSLIDSGYASLNDEGMVCFSEDAWMTRKLFSEIVISVTKELHLIPTNEGKVEELIHGLEERGNITPRGIVLVKKAHGLSPMMCSREASFSDTDTYIKDSGLENDLKLEYSGQTLPLSKFMDILNTQYNDAPEDLLDRLVETGVVKIEGSNVEVN